MRVAGWVLGLCIPLLTAAGWHVLREGDPPPREHDDGVSSTQHAQNAELQRLVMRVKRLESDRASSAERSSSVQPAPGPVVETDRAHPPDEAHPALSETEHAAARRASSERVAAEREATYTRLDERLATEPFDGHWRIETERALVSAAEQLSTPSVAFSETQCATSLCRSTFDHPELERPSRDFVASVTRSEAFGAMAGLIRYEKGRTSVYSIREGYDPVAP